MPTAGQHNLIGQTLAERYHVTDKLGVGGMGTVYKADDLKLESEVVVKTPHAALIKDAEFAARFHREIRSLVQLSHPHIVKVMDVGLHDGLPFAVMQYLPGGSLEERNRPCAPVEILEWLGDIADALDFMHQRGLIHRDIKPANILFDESGRAYLGDFGIAKVVAASEESEAKQITGTGTMIGTAEFMAPEMLMPDLYSDEYDERVDQYALAVTVYEMLAGRPPFRGDTIATVAVKLAKTKATLLHELRPGIPEALAKVVARGLLKKPDRRYPNCRAFAEAVFGAMSGDTSRRTAIGGRRLTGAEQRGKSAPRKERRATAAARTLQEKQSRRQTMAAVEEPAEIGDLFPLGRGTQSTPKPQRNAIVEWLKSPTGIALSVVCGIFLVAAIVVFKMLGDAPARPAAGPQQVNRGGGASSDSTDSVPQSTPLPQVDRNSQRITFDFDTGPGPNFSVFNEGGLLAMSVEGPDLRISKPADDGSVYSNKFLTCGIASEFAVDGDFNITIEFLLHDLPQSPNRKQLNESILGIVSKSDSFLVMRAHEGRDNRIGSYASPPGGPVQRRSSSITSGRYRISRIGSKATAYYAARDDPTFVSIGSVDRFTGPVRIKLYAAQGTTLSGGSRSKTALDISFDNLVIDADRIVGLVDTSSNETAPTPRPSLAVAPFDRLQAARHQQAWADHLNTPVEIENSIGMKFRLIPPGEFMMGSPQADVRGLAATNDRWRDRYLSEAPDHKVKISTPFYLGIHEVTQAQYRDVTGKSPSFHAKTGGGSKDVADLETDKFPVETVSWDDAVKFCNRLSNTEGLRPCYELSDGTVTILEGNGYRLPTEAEWESACRAGTETRWSFGDDGSASPDYARDASNPSNRSYPVGGLRQNPYGLFDMHGNVWEWCQDWYDAEYYPSSPTIDPKGPQNGTERVLRGGAFYVTADTIRSATRNRSWPTNQENKSFGFRVVKSLSASTAQPKPIRPLNTGLEKLRDLIGHTEQVRCVAFSPDGKHVLSGGVDKVIRLWDIESGQEVKFFRGHSSTVNRVAFLTDGRTAISASYDETIRLWDVASGKQLRIVDTDSDVRALIVDPVNNRVISGSRLKDSKRRGEIALWEGKTLSQLRRYTTKSAVWALSLSPDGKTLSSGCADGRIELRSLTDGVILKADRLATSVRSVKFSADGQSLYVRSDDGRIQRWGVAEGKFVEEMIGSEGAGRVAISPSGEYCLSAGRESTLWDLRTGKLIDRVKGTIESSDVSIGPQSRLAAITVGNTIQLWKLSHPDVVTASGLDTGTVSGMRVWIPKKNGGHVIFRSDDPSVWNRNTYEEGKFSVDVGQLKEEINWLRLQRADTGQSVIIPIQRANLTKLLSLPSGYVWNGTGARRFTLGLNSWTLGIGNPKWQGDWNGSVPVFVTTDKHSKEHVVGTGGWGFGHANTYRSGQHYTWGGKRIDKVVFEIAVKSSELSDEEKKLLTPANDLTPAAGSGLPSK